MTLRPDYSRGRIDGCPVLNKFTGLLFLQTSAQASRAVLAQGDPAVPPAAGPRARYAPVRRPDMAGFALALATSKGMLPGPA